MNSQTTQQPKLEFLDDLNIRNLQTISQVGYSFEIYETIADNAKVINKAKWQGHLWGNVQSIALDNIVLGLCKLFGNVKVSGIDQNNFEKVISHIRNENISAQTSLCIERFVRKYTDRNQIGTNLEELTKKFCDCFESYKSSKFEALEKLKKARDKRIAHSDLTEQVHSTASIADIEELIQFSIYFCQTISESFLNIGLLMDSHTSKKTTKLLRREFNFVNNALKLMQLRKACVEWGKNKDNITKIMLFGSKVDGIKCSEDDPQKPSDWDIAVEFIPLPNEDHLTTWVCESKGWQKEFEAILNDKDFGVIDFQSYHPTETEHTAAYIKQKSIVLFDRSLHC